MSKTTFANTVIKGSKEAVEEVISYINEHEDKFELEEEIDLEVNEETGTAKAYIPFYTDDFDFITLELLEHVKWMAFMEIWYKNRIDVIASDYESNKIDKNAIVCNYDFENDDRLSYTHYPDEDFVDEFLWSSAGEWETVDYSCPFAEWWNEN